MGMLMVHVPPPSEVVDNDQDVPRDAGSGSALVEPANTFDESADADAADGAGGVDGAACDVDGEEDENENEEGDAGSSEGSPTYVR